MNTLLGMLGESLLWTLPLFALNRSIRHAALSASPRTNWLENVVISTGAAPGCLCCLIGKLFGARVIWIDSLANVERMSLSGRIVARVADLLLVQWEDLAKRYRRARYAGSVL